MLWMNNTESWEKGKLFDIKNIVDTEEKSKQTKKK